MRRPVLLPLFLLVLAAFWGAACDWLPGGPTVIVTQTQTVAGAGASPSPGPAGCPAPQTIQLRGPSEMRVGEVRPLSATPFLAPGVPSPASCDDARRVVWEPGGPCSIEGRAYNPDLRADGPGVCEVSVLVDGVRSERLTVRVQ